jgi:hypothetical protein
MVITNKTLYLQLADFNENGQFIGVEPVTKVNYDSFKKTLLEYGEPTVLFDNMNVKYDVVLGDLQATLHDNNMAPNESKYCAIIYSFDSFALKKAARDCLWMKAAPFIQTKHTYKY